MRITSVIGLSILLNYSFISHGLTIAEVDRREDNGERFSLPDESKSNTKKRIVNVTNTQTPNHRTAAIINQPLQRIIAGNPKIEKLHSSLLKRAANPESDEGEKDGTDVALKKLALKFQKQVRAIMWNFAVSTVNQDSGFGVRAMTDELTHNLMDDELDDIGQPILEELRRSRDVRKKRRMG